MKKITVFILTALLLLSLIGCDGSAQPASSTSTVTTTVPTTGTTVPTTSSTPIPTTVPPTTPIPTTVPPTTPIPTTVPPTTSTVTTIPTTASATTTATAKPSTTATTGSPAITIPPHANILGIADFLYLTGFVPGMTQRDLFSLAESLTYEGKNIKEAVPGYFYDSQSGGEYRSQGSQFGISNDYTRSSDRTHATSYNSLYTYVPLEGLDLPCGITFKDNLATILQKIGLDLDYTRNFISYTGTPGVMVLYYDGTTFLTLVDMAQYPNASDSNTFSFSLGYTETYEVTLADGRIADVTRTFSMSFSGSEDTLSFISMSIQMKYPLNQG